MNERHAKARKLIEAISEECSTPSGTDHDWHKCRACLAREELDHRGVRKMLRDYLKATEPQAVGESSVARMAGNIAAGLVGPEMLRPGYLSEDAMRAAARLSVFLAREIVAELQTANSQKR